MTDTNEQIAKRHIINANGQKHYAIVSKEDFMVSSPNEGDIANRELYSLREGICRIASKARKSALTWDVVAEQLEKAAGGNNKLWVARLANVLREA